MGLEGSVTECLARPPAVAVCWSVGSLNKYSGASSQVRIMLTWPRVLVRLRNFPIYLPLELFHFIWLRFLDNHLIPERSVKQV